VAPEAGGAAVHRPAGRGEPPHRSPATFNAWEKDKEEKSRCERAARAPVLQPRVHPTTKVLDGYFVFTFVRDPLTRVVASFHEASTRGQHGRFASHLRGETRGAQNTHYKGQVC